MSASLPETLVLLAHQRHMNLLKTWMQKAGKALARYRLLTTVEIAHELEDCGHEITSVLSGENGGEVQLAGLVPTHSVLAVVFMHDPQDGAGMDFDVFQRVCDINGVPLASNIGTALGLIPWLEQPEALMTSEGETDAAAAQS